MAPYDITGRLKPTKTKKHAAFQKRKRDDVDVEKLQRAVDALDPGASFSNFSDLPLSEPTKAGLKTCHFATLTEIQAKAIALGLKGSDVLGAAKTGSGKTLAFLLPVLENLYRQQCVGQDAGLGAMIISPTRELAIQIFDVLYKIGKCGHMFAAGLIIGGKSLREEQDALARMNIVVCTPGRMLQHLSQTAAFNIDNLRMLVLDEADRILDMGFQRDVDAIIEYLPQERQTLLFSATQTKKVSDLARLSLRDPEYVAVHESATSATPKSLTQNYVLTPLSSKLDTLWSFIQSSKKSKMLVFLSSGKQVRFVYESFRKLQPGIPLLHLHGKQKQSARLDITTKFASAQHSCLFATDVVARGLDFPAVDWVVQVDCPEDADTYIHRVGRTARYERDGRAVLFLDPSEEEGMLERLAAKKVPIERINVRGKKQQSIRDQLQAMCFKDPELKYLGQKAFSTYVRSVHIQKDKDIFNVSSYALEDFAASLGLPGTPRIKFLQGDAEAAKKAKNAPRQRLSDSESDGENDAEVDGEQAAADKAKDQKDKQQAVRTRYDRMFERKNQDILSSHYSRMIADEDGSGSDAENPDHENTSPASDEASSDLEDNRAKIAKDRTVTNGKRGITKDSADDDDLFIVKRRIPAPEDEQESQGQQPKGKPDQLKLIVDSNRRARALKSRKATARLLGLKPSKVVFDDEGGAHEAHPFKTEKDMFPTNEEAEREEARKRFVEAEEEKMRGADELDRARLKERKREKKEKRRKREREEAAGAAGAPDDEDGDDGDDGGDRLERIERPFEELRDLYPSEDEGDAARGAAKADRGDDLVQKQAKKKKGKNASRAQLQQEPAETLEDLEKLASGLLA